MPHTNSKEWLKRNKLRNRNGPSSDKHSNNTPGSSSNKTPRRAQVVEYDEKDRYEYLTGFSARKKAGKVAAQERAARRAREEKLEFRRQLKDARLSKIKEAIDQQTEWYGIDAFEGGMETKATTGRSEKFVEKSATATTTVTIEDMEVDHNVLIDKSSKNHGPDSHCHYQPHPERNFDRTCSTSTGKKVDNGDKAQRQGGDGRMSAGSSSKVKKSNTNKKKKIPYESKATRSIARAKRESKRKGKPSRRK
ncbi:hypothetical protein VP01_121g7 [Puccinia sorghi]|uniref:Ribosomal RNA-processing protein 17 n=1 Tax=Puccinia sorghi TaxID=27349 RepID=A0A0L6VRK4_9BASI|nr:hypothetical protein VP01_121g7 [Puccinia sorghi]